MDRNCKLKTLTTFHLSQIQYFKGFFKQFFPYWRLPLVKISARSWLRVHKFPKRVYFMDAELIQKEIENICFHNHICHTDETHHIYILLGSFNWQNFVVYLRGYTRLSTKKHLNWAKIIFWSNFNYFLILQKTAAYLMHHLACNHLSKM